MARKSRSYTTAVAVDSPQAGAFEVDKNAATIGGYACLAAGSALALGVGAAVAPAPVLGLTAVGGGLVVAGNFQDIKAHFASDEKKADAPASA